MPRIFSLIVHLSVFQVSKQLYLIVTPLVGFSFFTFVRLENKADLLQTEHLKFGFEGKLVSKVFTCLIALYRMFPNFRLFSIHSLLYIAL